MQKFIPLSNKNAPIVKQPKYMVCCCTCGANGARGACTPNKLELQNTDVMLESIYGRQHNQTFNSDTTLDCRLIAGMDLVHMTMFWEP